MHLLATPENIFLFVAAFGTLQSMLLALLIFFHPKSDHRVNKFLSLYIFFLAMTMAGPILLQFASWQYNFFTEPFTTSSGTFMYLYVRSMRETITWRKAAPHLIPFTAASVAAIICVTYLNNKYPIPAKEMPPEVIQSSLLVWWLIVRFSILYLYYFLSRRALYTYQHSIRHIFSETSQLDVNWIRLLLNGYALLVTISVAVFFAMQVFPQYTYIFYLATIAIATPYVYLATYKSLAQPTIWQRSKKMGNASIEEQMAASIAIEKEKHNPGKQNKPTTSDPLVAETASRIIRMMEEDKLYQETELTLQELSDKLALPSHRVSVAINDGLKKNFYDLVNSYRVEEAKRLLLDQGSANYTVLSVGFEAGFNSKTTFNTVFKKFTGFTPTEYREKNKAVSIGL